MFIDFNYVLTKYLYTMLCELNIFLYNIINLLRYFPFVVIFAKLIYKLQTDSSFYFIYLNFKINNTNFELKLLLLLKFNVA